MSSVNKSAFESAVADLILLPGALFFLTLNRLFPPHTWFWKKFGVRYWHFFMMYIGHDFSIKETWIETGHEVPKRPPFWKIIAERFLR